MKINYIVFILKEIFSRIKEWLAVLIKNKKIMYLLITIFLVVLMIYYFEIINASDKICDEYECWKNDDNSKLIGFICDSLFFSLGIFLMFVALFVEPLYNELDAIYKNKDIDFDNLLKLVNKGINIHRNNIDHVLLEKAIISNNSYLISYLANNKTNLNFKIISCDHSGEINGIKVKKGQKIMIPCNYIQLAIDNYCDINVIDCLIKNGVNTNIKQYYCDKTITTALNYAKEKYNDSLRKYSLNEIKTKKIKEIFEFLSKN